MWHDDNLRHTRVTVNVIICRDENVHIVSVNSAIDSRTPLTSLSLGGAQSLVNADGISSSDRIQACSSENEPIKHGFLPQFTKQ